MILLFEQLPIGHYGHLNFPNVVIFVVNMEISLTGAVHSLGWRMKIAHLKGLNSKYKDSSSKICKWTL